MMRAFVVGSLRHVPEGERELLHRACRALGEELARRGHALVVNSQKLTTVDPWIVDGFREGAGGERRTIVVYRPDPDQVPEPSDRPKPYGDVASKAGTVTFEFPTPEGNHRVSHLRSILAADVVIAMGGSPRGTATVIYSAEPLRKPVVIVRAFGGAAADAWRDFKRYYEVAECAAFEAAPSAANISSWAGDIVSQAAAFVSRNPMNSLTGWTLTALVLAVLTGIGVWAASYVLGDPSSPNGTAIALVGMAFGASVFGTAMRRVVMQSQFPWAGLRPTHPLLEWLMGIGLALFLLLLALSAGTGLARKKVGVLTVDDLREVGVSISIIVLVSAFFIELAWDRVLRLGRKALP